MNLWDCLGFLPSGRNVSLLLHQIYRQQSFGRDNALIISCHLYECAIANALTEPDYYPCVVNVHFKSIVEMAGPWKAWKTQPSNPTAARKTLAGPALHIGDLRG